MRLFKPRCMCGIEHLGFRAAAVRCPRHGSEEREEDLGVIPGYRVAALKKKFLEEDSLEGSDFQRMLDELQPCKHCGEGTHNSDACGRSPERIRELENVQMVAASAAVIPGRSSAAVIPSGMTAVEYGELLRAAYEKDPNTAGARMYQKFLGLSLPVFEIGKSEPVEHIPAYEPLPLEGGT